MEPFAFNSRKPEYKDPFGAVSSNTKITFNIRPPRNFAVSKPKLVILHEDEEIFSVSMQWSGIEGSNDVFTCEYEAGEPGLYFYRFELSTPHGMYYINRGEGGTGIPEKEKKSPFQLTVFDPEFKTPEWIKGGVMYQIFPDRFARDGDFPSQIPQDRVLMKNWGEKPQLGEGDNYKHNIYFGGNFKGIVSKLEYLKSLGVTSIYLNPIFESHSYHRYDTADYMKVDPLLGGNKDFKEMCDAAKKLGIRIIIDGVFNHTGADSVYFNRDGRYKEKGAYQSKDSKYYEWYDFQKWPDKYSCWWGFVDLPDVNELNPNYLNFITGESGVAEYWLKNGASGWRLDVVDELPDEFVDLLRKRIKKTDPQAMILGEVWEDASNKSSYGNRRHYLQGNQLDSVMNYPWRSAIIDYLKTGNALIISESVMTILENYPKQSIDVTMNLLGTHDTIRIITCLAGESAQGKDSRWKENARLSEKQRELGLTLLRLASTLQFFLPGVPCIYYGDEVGMEGYPDPYNRLCYPWGNEDSKLIDWYKRLSQLRKSCPAMKDGGYRQIASHDGLFAFSRTDRNGNDYIIIAVNAGTKEECIKAPGRLNLSHGGAWIDNDKLILPQRSCAVVGVSSWAENDMKSVIFELFRRYDK